MVRATFKRSALPRSGVPKSSRAPGAQVRGPSRLASPTVRPRVFDLPDARMRRSVPLDLPMPSLLLRRYSTTTATASWCARSPVLPGQIEAHEPRCARLSKKMTQKRARIALSQTPPRRPVPNPPLLACLQDHSSTTSCARAWTATPTPRLRGWWPRSSTSGDELLRPAHPPRARQGERPSNHRPFAPLRA